MIYRKMQSLILDDNNCVSNYGKLTTICPVCGNVYTARLKVEMTCHMDPYQEGYRFKYNPDIVKMCDCRGKESTVTERIDNALVHIIKTLYNKNYPIIYDKCCEGHAYQSGTEVVYKSFPIITINAHIWDVRKRANELGLDIALDTDGHSVIIPVQTSIIEDYSVEEFDNYKEQMLYNILEFVKCLPMYIDYSDKDEYVCDDCGMIFSNGHMGINEMKVRK